MCCFLIEFGVYGDLISEPKAIFYLLKGDYRASGSTV